MSTILNKVNKLKSNISPKQQFTLVRELIENRESEEAMLELLVDRRLVSKLDLSYLDSIIFEFLFMSKNPNIKQGLNDYLPNGLVNLTPDLVTDYQSLQQLLLMHQYQEADKLTQQQLCNLAGLDQSNKRDWLYFTDILFLPSKDLIIIDTLWKVYSRYKFGFSKQRQIWLANNQNWELFWHQIGWKDRGKSRRYPDEFVWNINAPNGHLPLFNQLRGVQVFSSLLNHMAWNQ